MRLQAPHCPSCGAPVDVPPGAERVVCSFCQTTLVVEAHAVSTRGAAPRHAPEKSKAPPFPEPEATLRNWAVPRFELSLIEQPIPGAVPEVFAGLELPDERFAFISLRIVDADGAPVAVSLQPAFDALTSSLQNDGDPGLSANLALEALCAGPFSHRLEVAIALFEPARMRVTPYSAGAREALAWVSSEEGRTIVISGHGNTLERKSLRERGDHFENGRPIHLAAHDLVLFPSPGFLGRGAKGYGNGLHAMTEAANAHLGAVAHRDAREECLLGGLSEEHLVAAGPDGRHQARGRARRAAGPRDVDASGHARGAEDEAVRGGAPQEPWRAPCAVSVAR
jgi:LSD1 subclass zinc finger protein